MCVDDRWVMTNVGSGLCCKDRISADEIFCVLGAGKAEQIHILTKIGRNYVQKQATFLSNCRGIKVIIPRVLPPVLSRCVDEDTRKLPSDLFLKLMRR